MQCVVGGRGAGCVLGLTTNASWLQLYNMLTIRRRRPETVENVGIAVYVSIMMTDVSRQTQLIPVRTCVKWVLQERKWARISGIEVEDLLNSDFQVSSTCH